MLTPTTPSRANPAPSYPPTNADPFMNDPPWIKTSTGSPLAPSSGVHTFRFRHSSPGITTSGNSRAYCGGESPFGTVGPHAVASPPPSHPAGEPHHRFPRHLAHPHSLVGRRTVAPQLVRTIIILAERSVALAPGKWIGCLARWQGM